MRKPDFCLCKNKGADQLRKLISAFVFATPIVQSLFFLNPNVQASSMLRSVCVRSGQKPRRPRGSNDYVNILVFVFYGDK